MNLRLLSLAACIIAAIGAGVNLAIGLLAIISGAQASPISCLVCGCILLFLSVWNGIMATKADP